MERWAANTGRTLGIILTAGFVMITSLLLALFSLCASQGGLDGTKHPEQVVPCAAAAVVLLTLGTFVIRRLSRGISHSQAVPQGGETTPPSIVSPQESTVPLPRSTVGRTAIDRLVLALAAQIVLSA